MEKPAITFASFQVLEAQVSKYKAVFQGTIESVARSELTNFWRKSSILNFEIMNYNYNSEL